jgi:hypothetical protein
VTTQYKNCTPLKLIKSFVLQTAVFRPLSMDTGSMIAEWLLETPGVWWLGTEGVRDIFILTEKWRVAREEELPLRQQGETDHTHAIMRVRHINKVVMWVQHCHAICRY